MSIELDELPLLDKSIRGFRYNRAAFASIHDRDYGGPGEGSIPEKLRGILERAGLQSPHRVTLLTVPRILGYVFNPVSFYLLRRDDDALIGLVAEVRNTFGESHHYVLRPDCQIEAPDEVVHFSCAKRFYVSPFLDRSGEYHIQVRAHDDHLDIAITLHQDGQQVFAARMVGSGRVLSNRAFWSTVLRFPPYAATVMAKIHWQALRLRLFRSIPLYAKPQPLAGESAAARKISVWHRIRAAIVARGKETSRMGQRDSLTIITGSQTP